MKMRALLTLIMATATAYGGTVSGTLQGASGLPVKNGTLTFKLQQAGLIIGTGSVVPATAYCYTSTDGSVVGTPNPLTLPSTSINYGSGTLPAGIYYVVFSFYDSGANRTLVSPELQVQLTGGGSLNISPPLTWPSSAAGMTIYIGSASGAETAQGNTAGPTQIFTQSTPLVAGMAPVVTNVSPCSIAFNDTIIPYGGYNVSLISASGNAYPGWPQAWQLNGGLSGTVNISNGAPLWNGTVIYPMPILSQPLNHGPQSISGSLNMTGYNLVNVGKLGVGTSTPAWGIDVVGFINATQGYLYNGGAGTIGHCLVSNGTAYVDAPCGSWPTIYYQHMLRNGSIFNQEPYLNFSPDFSMSDNPGSTRTEVGLLASGVTAGSYTSTNLTVDANGRITAASNGPAVPIIKQLVINSGMCTTGTTAYSQCSVSASWSTAFADSSYALACTPFTPSALTLGGFWISAKSASGFTVTIQNDDASGANAISLSEIDCIGMHP